MERYTVLWAVDVQNDFTEKWIGSDSPTRKWLTDIANTIDLALANEPQSRGTSLPSEPSLRVLTLPSFNPAVSVVFEVIAEDRIARVLRITANRT